MPERSLAEIETGECAGAAIKVRQTAKPVAPVWGRTDALNGYVSREKAASDYGVVLRDDPSTDEKATEDCRKALRGKRTRRGRRAFAKARLSLDSRHHDALDEVTLSQEKEDDDRQDHRRGRRHLEFPACVQHAAKGCQTDRNREVLR